MSRHVTSRHVTQVNIVGRLFSHKGRVNSLCNQFMQKSVKLLILLPYLSHPAFPSLFTVMMTAPFSSLVTWMTYLNYVSVMYTFRFIVSSADKTRPWQNHAVDKPSLTPQNTVGLSLLPCLGRTRHGEVCLVVLMGSSRKSCRLRAACCFVICVAMVCFGLCGHVVSSHYGVSWFMSHCVSWFVSPWCLMVCFSVLSHGLCHHIVSWFKSSWFLMVDVTSLQVWLLPVTMKSACFSDWQLPPTLAILSYEAVINPL